MRYKDLHFLLKGLTAEQLEMPVQFKSSDDQTSRCGYYVCESQGPLLFGLPRAEVHKPKLDKMKKPLNPKKSMVKSEIKTIRNYKDLRNTLGWSCSLSEEVLGSEGFCVKYFTYVHLAKHVTVAQDHTMLLLDLIDDDPKDGSGYSGVTYEVDTAKLKTTVTLEQLHIRPIDTIIEWFKANGSSYTW